MAVQCANCGEDLLGAVNRCWRCGQVFVPQKGSGDAPPIRRAPIASAEGPPVLAEAIGHPRFRAAKRIRRGSPFASADRHSNDASLQEGQQFRPYSVYVPRNGAAGVGAALSSLLGPTSLLMNLGFPTGALVVGLIGVGVGCWGLTSERRGLATCGLVLCCLAVAVAGFLVVVDLYSSVYGVNPFALAFARRFG
jgi:hypothetical protein